RPLTLRPRVLRERARLLAGSREDLLRAGGCLRENPIGLLARTGLRLLRLRSGPRAHVPRLIVRGDAHAFRFLLGLRADTLRDALGLFARLLALGVDRAYGRQRLVTR